MVEPSGWHCHPVATEERFTQVNFYFLILTQNNRKVRKINAFLDWDLHHGSELLSASCGFDSRWEHSRKLQAMQNRDNADCASLLANKLCCSYFYRAPARDRGSEDSEVSMV